jgi:hypothetical protein
VESRYPISPKFFGHEQRVAVEHPADAKVVQVRIGPAHGRLDVLVESVQRIITDPDAPPDRAGGVQERNPELEDLARSPGGGGSHRGSRLVLWEPAPLGPDAQFATDQGVQGPLIWSGCPASAHRRLTCPRSRSGFLPRALRRKSDLVTRFPAFLFAMRGPSDLVIALPTPLPLGS